MILAIVIILSSLFWLMYETRWLTIRLPIAWYAKTGDILISELLLLIIGMGEIVGHKCPSGLTDWILQYRNVIRSHTKKKVQSNVMAIFS